MKRLIKILAALVGALVIAALIVPFFIPVETYKRAVIERVRAATGRELAINGPVHVSVFPDLGVKLERVTLSNAPGYSDASMVQVESMTAEAALLPLLHGDVEVKRFILEKPVVHLEVNAKGEPNWRMTTAEAPSAPLPAAEKQGGHGPVRSVALGEIKIKDGAFTYRDERNKRVYNASDLSLEVSLKNLDAPLTIKGEALWNQQPLRFELQAQAPRAVSEGGESPLKATLEGGDLVKLYFDGKASQTAASGHLDFRSASLPKLAAWAGAPIAWKGRTPLSLSVNTNLSCTQTQCEAANGQFAVDANKATGDIKLGWGGIVPSVQGKLAFGELDLNPYLEKASGHAGLSPVGEAQAAEAGWSDDKLDFSGLHAINADMMLGADSVRYQTYTLSKVSAKVQLGGGVLKVDASPLSLYGGTVKFAGSLNGDANGVDATINASGIQVESMLKELAQFDRLTGTGEMDTHVTGHGASVRQIIASLSGGGHVRVRNGTIRGVNLAQLAQSATALVTGASTAGQKTDFAELSGSYTLAQGIAHNNDLALTASLLHATGAGTVDLPQRQVHYKLSVSLAGAKQGLAVPVLVDGSFDQLSFRPDVQGVLKDALQNPEAAKATLQNLKDQVKSGKGNVGQQLQDIKKNPQQLNNLLQGLGR
ncbi:MAG: AsmA family protein [Alphaproteobacteria bacterium]|nr:AsmA family protein [Alphaproteobacteria bacterium]